MWVSRKEILFYRYLFALVSLTLYLGPIENVKKTIFDISNSTFGSNTVFFENSYIR